MTYNNDDNNNGDMNHKFDMNNKLNKSISYFLCGLVRVNKYIY